MKRFLLPLSLLLGLSSNSLAQQFPNGDLETWTTSNGADHAPNWLTTDDILLDKTGVFVATGTTSKTTVQHGGSFAALLETKTLFPFPSFPGSLTLGSRFNTSSDYPAGLPYTGRPAGLQFYYQSSAGLAADSAFALMVLTRRVNGQREIIAEGITWLPAAATYTAATVALQYASALTPDSVHVTISSGIVNRATPGTQLYVDDITFVSTLTAARAETVGQSLTLFPNPSADGLFTLDARQEPGLLRAPLTVSDLAGRVVLTQAAPSSNSENRCLDLRGQPAGVYTLRLSTSKGLVTRRLIIQ